MKSFLLMILIVSTHQLMAQKYSCRDGYVKFFSEAPMEDIEAHNNEGTSIFKANTGEVAFSVPIKGFTFDKSLMQEHFNEKYMESDKFPNTTFKGSITGYSQGQPGWQDATANGEFTIHGVTKNVDIEGEVQFSGNQCTMKATFPVRLEDYNIKIPKVVFYNIAEVVEVTINFDYKKSEDAN